jgi:hypothetical protein
MTKPSRMVNNNGFEEKAIILFIARLNNDFKV